MRALGLDLGSKRIGVAVTDGAGQVATPVTTVRRTGDRPADRRRIRALVAEYEADVVVVGLPLSLDGTEGPAAVAARGEVDALARVVGVPVEVHDERMTTAEAHQRLAEAGLDSRARRQKVDQTAAALILQAWADRASSS